MKKQILITVITLLCFGCKDKPKQQSTNAPKELIVVQAIDFSASTSHLNYVNQRIATKLYYTLAENAGTLKVLSITDNSSLQNIYTLQTKKLDTLSLSGVSNIYDRAKVAKQNAQKLTTFQKQAQTAINDYIAHATPSQKAQFTDLNSCFTLIQQTLSSPLYAKHSKYVIACTDMINSPKKGNVRFLPVECPNTTFLFVRPSLTLDSLRSLFPSSTVMVFTDMEDAIEMIHKTQY